MASTTSATGSRSNVWVSYRHLRDTDVDDRCRLGDRPPRPRDWDDGVREEHVLALACCEDRLAGGSSRLPFLEARLGCAVGGRVAREATRPACRRRVDRRWQLPRDTRPPPRTRGHHCVSRHALVSVRRTRLPARPAEAGWLDAQWVRRFRLATVAL